MVDLDTATLRAFVAVVTHGSITGAAKALGMPKSSVSRALLRVEEEAGRTLVHRSTRHVAPTDEGREFAARCEAALRQVDDAVEWLRGVESEPRGQLRIATTPVIATVLARTLVPTLVARHPRVELRLTCGHGFVDLLQSGIDVAIRLGKPPESIGTARRLGAVSAVLVASPSYLRRRGAPTTAEELSLHDCLTFGSDTKKSESWPLGDGVRVRGRVRVDDLSALRELCLAGLGVTYLPRFLVARDLEAGSLERVLPNLPCAGPPVWIVSVGGRERSRVASVAIGELEHLLPAALDIAAVAGASSRTGRGDSERRDTSPSLRRGKRRDT